MAQTIRAPRYQTRVWWRPREYRTSQPANDPARHIEDLPRCGGELRHPWADQLSPKCRECRRCPRGCRRRRNEFRYATQWGGVPHRRPPGPPPLPANLWWRVPSPEAPSQRLRTRTPDVGRVRWDRAEHTQHRFSEARGEPRTCRWSDSCRHQPPPRAVRRVLRDSVPADWIYVPAPSTKWFHCRTPQPRRRGGLPMLGPADLECAVRVDSQTRSDSTRREYAGARSDLEN